MLFCNLVSFAGFPINDNVIREKQFEVEKSLYKCFIEHFDLKS